MNSKDSKSPKKNLHSIKIDNRLAKEKAEYAKSDAPKLTPSNTNAKELMG